MADIQTNFPVSVSNFPSVQTVAVNNFPATQPISGTITVTQATAANLNATVTGTVAVSNFPATQPISGSISVSNFPATQPISGSVSVSNFPATQVVSFGETSTGVINFYNNAASIASSASGTITYTVTAGKTFYLKQVTASSSGGPCKVVVVTGSGGGAVTQAVVFYSAATLSATIPFAQPIPVSAGTPVNVQVWNLAGAAMDVYASINGHEV